MSSKRKTPSVAIASEENNTVRSKRVKRKTEFYAKSSECSALLHFEQVLFLDLFVALKSISAKFILSILINFKKQFNLFTSFYKSVNNFAINGSIFLEKILKL